MATEWNEFFLMVGGGTAALAGLVFVAISLNLSVLLRNPAHRYRAVGTLAGFTATFIICGLALMPSQSYQTIGLEWLLVSIVMEFVHINAAKHTKGSTEWLSLPRFLAAHLGYLTQIIGSILVLLGYTNGLYVAATSMVIYFAFLISGAWLLVVGAHQSQS